MDVTLAGRGIILGFSIAAAVGPISLLVIRRTLASGWLVGVASGLGVATADGIYGAVAAFGSDGHLGPAWWPSRRPLGLIGGAALDGAGSAHSTRPAPYRALGGPTTSRGLAAAYLSTVALTLTNPMTIILFAAIVVSLGIRQSTADAALLATGFLLGSAAGGCCWSHRWPRCGAG